MQLNKSFLGLVWLLIRSFRKLKQIIRNTFFVHIILKIFNSRLSNVLRLFKFKLFFKEYDKDYDIIIFDDVFPHPLSPFRLTEFNIYLTHFSNLKIYCSALSFPALGETKPFEQILKTYQVNYNIPKNKVEFFNQQQHFKAHLAYIVFLQNIIQILPTLEKYQVPFIFTLYPGGGLLLNDLNCDKNMRRVFRSIYFKQVIVTQKIIYDYLLERKLCSKDKITFVFGVVMPTHFFEPSINIRKTYFPIEKHQFDICFVAHKYMPQGKDKGYDLFIETCRLLNHKFSNMHFHVVGPWLKEDYSIIDFEYNVHFYGSQTSAFFPEFYSKMDIILSPNRPFTLFPGAFDGFPTGSVTEASLNGVAMFVTDLLKLNCCFDNNYEIVIINDNPENIAEKIEFYYNHPDLLYCLANKGKEKSWKLYNLDTQMKPRIELIESILNERIKSNHC
jgi:glycosyltransferase involved in cell wall biosynthesis